VLAQIEAAQEPLGFVSIDADHSREGIQRDIHSVLRYTPVKPLYIVMHDSFNPDCRNGMPEANRPANAHVHLLELDFVTGRSWPRRSRTGTGRRGAFSGSPYLCQSALAERSSYTRMKPCCFRPHYDIPSIGQTMVEPGKSRTRIEIPHQAPAPTPGADDLRRASQASAPEASLNLPVSDRA